MIPIYLACLFLSCSIFILLDVDFIDCCWGLQIFLGALEKGGVGALELVAMDMKARLEGLNITLWIVWHLQITITYFYFHFTLFRGMYVCRTLSYEGAEFEVIEAPLEEKMKVWLISVVASWVINWCSILASYYMNMSDNEIEWVLL